MQDKIINVTIIIACLSALTLGIAAAQPKSPLAGIPRMSTEPGGPEMQKFETGIEKVYLVFDYETESPVEIIAEIRSEAQQGAVIFNSRETYSGTGTANLEIPGPSSAFAEGVYDTIIRFRRAEGDERTLNITAGWEWTVGDVELPVEDPESAQIPISRQPDESQPNTVASSSETTNPNASPSIQSATPPQTTPGISPIILIGIAAIVVLLVGIIAWAVRGFMTAA